MQVRMHGALSTNRPSQTADHFGRVRTTSPSVGRQDLPMRNRFPSSTRYSVWFANSPEAEFERIQTTIRRHGFNLPFLPRLQTPPSFAVAFGAFRPRSGTIVAYTRNRVGGGGYRDGNRELPELMLHYRRQHWPISQMQMEVHRYSSSGQDGGRPVRNSSQTASHRCSGRSVQRRHAASCDLRRLDSSTARQHCNFKSRRTARRCMSQPAVSCQRYCRVNL